MHLKMLSAEVSIETVSVDPDPVGAFLPGSTLFVQEASAFQEMTCRLIASCLIALYLNSRSYIYMFKASL